MTRYEQISLWAKGTSLHNYQYGECCPDFSCCHQRIKTDQSEKELFLDAWKARRMDVIDGMLLMFLSKALLLQDIPIYIPGFYNA